MALNAVASQSGRSTRQNHGTTPARNTSPNKRGTRSGSTAPQSTPGTRRSARTSSRPIDQSKDAINNPALPEIQTRQSYAYGSSKAPQLPEQLHARGTMSMQQVADQMNSDIHKAQMNLEEVADNQFQHQVYSKDTASGPKKQVQITDQEEAQQTRRRHATPASQTTEVQKQRRTAAWASSLDESQLDDVPEESSAQDSPETRRTDPSSFPSGIFDHSYAYERGIRAARVQKQPSAINGLFKNMWKAIQSCVSATIELISRLREGLLEWLSLLSDTVTKALFEIPKSGFMIGLSKILVIMCIAASMHFSFCYLYRHVVCDVSSNSSISQSLERLCGACQNTYSGSWNFTANDNKNIHRITASLNSISSRINSLEAKLANRIDSKYAGVQVEMDVLRRQQTDLTGLLENLGQGSDNDIASPLIPRVNFFAPANGAIVNPGHTSPTRSRVRSLPVRVVLASLGMKRYEVNGPVTALLPWQDVGDCWCASASQPGQDSVRLGVEVREMIYPTELVIEHPPIGTTLSPDTAPREIELWADVDHYTNEQRIALGIDKMRTDGAGVRDPLSSKNNRIFARFATVEYDASSRKSNHVQRFKLDINQFRDLKYSGQTFVIRARTNHGADYSCIYRVRLHGVPVAENARQSKFEKEWLEDENSQNGL